MKKILMYFFCMISLFALECKEKFSLQTQGNLSSLEILEEIAQSCQLSVIYLDSLSKELLSQSKPKFYIRKMDASSFLDLLLDESVIMCMKSK